MSAFVVVASRQVRRLTVPLIDEDTWDYHMSSLCPFFGVLLFINVAFDVTSPIIGPVCCSCSCSCA